MGVPVGGGRRSARLARRARARCAESWRGHGSRASLSTSQPARKTNSVIHTTQMGDTYELIGRGAPRAGDGMAAVQAYQRVHLQQSSDLARLFLTCRGWVESNAREWRLRREDREQVGRCVGGEQATDRTRVRGEWASGRGSCASRLNRCPSGLHLGEARLDPLQKNKAIFHHPVDIHEASTCFMCRQTPQDRFAAHTSQVVDS